MGIINARRIFGMGAIKMSEKIDMCINMEIWDATKLYDRMGIDSEYTEILGIRVPVMTIPVKPGRNLAVIIEVAAMNNRQRKKMATTPPRSCSPAWEWMSASFRRGYQKGSGYLMKHAYTIIADLHTHTLFSGHAHSTFSEMVGAARDKGLYALAVTDHTGVMPGSPVDWYFSSLHELPLHYKGVLTIVGAETNILDFEGNTDLGRATPASWTGWWPPSTGWACRAWKTRTWRSAPTCGAKSPRTPG